MLGIEEIIINEAGADLALIKVEGRIDIGRFSPICLPQKGQIISVVMYLFLRYL